LIYFVIREETTLLTWFAKWFGGRKEASEDTDEPARFAPPTVRRPEEPARTSPARTPGLAAAPKKGFDPYNSGSFERRHAWERVSRR
jgi:hypothetical protein